MRKSGLVVGGAFIALTGVGLLVGWVTVRHWAKQPAPAKPAAVPTVFVGPEITLTGALQPQSTENVDAPVAGLLDAWFVDVGAEVYEDQLVGRIRNADLDNTLQTNQSALDRAQMRVAALDAQAANAKLDVSSTEAVRTRAHNELDRVQKIYERYKHLFELDALARLTYEKSEADYKSAETEAANRDHAADAAKDKAASIDHDTEVAKRALAEQTSALEKAKESVAEGDLHSPADGMVLARNVHQGDKVEGSQKALMTIATELAKLAVSVTPNAQVLARIHAGQHAFVRIADAELPGEVHAVRGPDVIIWLTAPEPVTKLGTAAQVRIVF